ncbi:hypothetical protein Srubr_19980 [Streptomyces rubradiris]|uniref:SDR family NAD(P)-dependent oxidoreductase n=1 Tax=Streptomyces rubradiris TaxID=285531 RepID=A0ABQ3R8I7_STRRR|nr:hypothetical protein GCM10018792_59720 [Streptomyces rubradiris]GHI52152.1 hypothetical protein Srubr_19980 [Streptomyces rubradiris]
MAGMGDDRRDADFAGKVAVVTGGARGVGRKTVALLSARGARVVAVDLRPETEDCQRSFPVSWR